MKNISYLKSFSLVFLIFILLFTSCSTRKDEYTADGRLILKYWEKWTGFEGDAMQAVVDQFNETVGKEKKIFVEMLNVSAIDRKMLVATAGGDPPDIAGVWSWIINVYADKGAVMPLDDFMKESDIDRDKWVPFFIDICSHRGKTWAFPTTPATIALHWNKRLFREFMPDHDPNKPPKTLQELDEFTEKMTVYELADGKKITYYQIRQLPVYKELLKKSNESYVPFNTLLEAPGMSQMFNQAEIIQFGFLPFEPGWWNWAWVFWFNGRLWDGKEKITANSPENIACLKWIQSYPQKYGMELVTRFSASAGSQFASPQNPFLCSKVAMEMQGVWMYNFIRKYAPGMDWGAEAFPSAGRDLKDVTIGECDCLVIPINAPHPKDSFEFLKFVNTQEAMELLCAGHRKFSPLQEVSNSFYRENPHPYMNVFRRLAESENIHTEPITSIGQEYKREFNVIFDGVRYLEMTPENALSDLQGRMQKILDRELERLRRRGKIQ